MISGPRPLKTALYSPTERDTGFTIVETMIFLAVSAIILVSALTLVNGAQRKNEFNQGVRDLQQQINDVIDNVSTGYTAGRSDTFACRVVGAGPPQEDVNAKDLGANQDCIFIGKVMQFEDGNQFRVYSIIGRRTKSSDDSLVVKMADAQPRAFSKLVETKTIRNGLKPKTMKDSAGGISSIGFFSTLNPTDSVTKDSGAQQVDMVPIHDSSTLLTANSSRLDSWPASGWTKLMTNYDSGAWPNPTSGVELCFEGPNTDQKATIIIGGSDQASGTNLKYGNGTC